MTRRWDVFRLMVRNFLVVTAVVAGILAVVFGVIWMRGCENGSSVAKMEIFLDGTTLEEVHENGKQIKYEQTEVIILDGEDEAEYTGVEFKGHGNSSWVSEKKSYRIKFVKKVDLLGMGKAKKWILVGNHDDDSLLRNDVGLLLSRMLANSPITGEFVELSVNGEELGLYYVVKAPVVNKSVIWLKEPMGILVEYDNAYEGGDDATYQTNEGGFLAVKDMVADDMEDEALEDFGKSFDKLEKAAKRHDFAAAEEVADMKSFAEYFLISELSGNPDAYLTSFYMYKDGEEDKIHAGIGWDFDAGFGNRNWGTAGDEFYAPTTMMARRESILSEDGAPASRIFYDLIETPEFYDLVCEVYQEKMLGKGGEIVDYIKVRAKEIEGSAEMNQEIWRMNDFEEAVDYLEWWAGERFRIFDEVYGGKVRLPSGENTIY